MVTPSRVGCMHHPCHCPRWLLQEQRTTRGGHQHTTRREGGKRGRRVNIRQIAWTTTQTHSVCSAHTCAVVIGCFAHRSRGNRGLMRCLRGRLWCIHVAVHVKPIIPRVLHLVSVSGRPEPEPAAFVRDANAVAIGINRAIVGTHGGRNTAGGQRLCQSRGAPLQFFGPLR